MKIENLNSKKESIMGSKIVKWKKILFAIVAVLVMIRVLYIGVRGEVDKEYYVSTQYDLDTVTAEVPCKDITIKFISEQDRLNSLELLFDNLPDDPTGSITLKICIENDLLYQTNISLQEYNLEWKKIKIFVNAPIQSETEYTININANEDCTSIPYVFLIDNERKADEIIGIYQNGVLVNGGC
jgi:hypothetical protein